MNVTVLYFAFPEHTVQWKPPGVDEEILFDDSRDQVRADSSKRWNFVRCSISPRGWIVLTQPQISRVVSPINLFNTLSRNLFVSQMASRIKSTVSRFNACRR